jgi:hypothetical protein
VCGAGIAQWSSAGLRSGWSGVRVPAWTWNFSLHHSRVRTDSGAHPASYPMSARALSLGVKRSERETHHLPPSSVEVKNTWSYTSTTQYAFMAWCSVKAQGQFYLLNMAKIINIRYSAFVRKNGPWTCTFINLQVLVVSPSVRKFGGVIWSKGLFITRLTMNIIYSWVRALQFC